MYRLLGLCDHLAEDQERCCQCSLTVIVVNKAAVWPVLNCTCIFMHLKSPDSLTRFLNFYSTSSFNPWCSPFFSGLVGNGLLRDTNLPGRPTLSAGVGIREWSGACERVQRGGDGGVLSLQTAVVCSLKSVLSSHILNVRRVPWIQSERSFCCQDLTGYFCKLSPVA